MEEVADDTGLVGPVDLRTGFSVTGDLVAAGLGGAISWGGCLATGALAALPGGVVPLGRRLLVDDVCGAPLACFVAALLTTADAFGGLLITDGDLPLAEPAFALGAFSDPAVGGGLLQASLVQWAARWAAPQWAAPAWASGLPWVPQMAVSPA